MRGRKTSPRTMTSIKRARRLRQAAPATERTLWRALRHRRLAGFKIRRQVPIGPYVADFVCLRHRLIIEADGPFHDARTWMRRDAWLRSQGFRVLRFTNREIDNLDHVHGRILEAVEAPPFYPSPLVGEGGPEGAGCGVEDHLRSHAADDAQHSYASPSRPLIRPASQATFSRKGRRLS